MRSRPIEDLPSVDMVYITRLPEMMHIEHFEVCRDWVNVNETTCERVLHVGLEATDGVVAHVHPPHQFSREVVGTRDCGQHPRQLVVLRLGIQTRWHPSKHSSDASPFADGLFVRLGIASRPASVAFSQVRWARVKAPIPRNLRLLATTLPAPSRRAQNAISDARRQRQTVRCNPGVVACKPPTCIVAVAPR